MERRASELRMNSPGRSSRSSSTTPVSSSRTESFDFRRYPPQSECEEFASLRWLPSGLRPSTASSGRRSDQSWSEGYVPICRHGKVGDRRIFPSREPCGAKCFFQPAGGLMVREDRDQIWLCTDRVKHGERSWHAIQLVEGYHLDIRGIIDTAALLPDIEYVVHLLFRFTGESFGFILQEASLEAGSQTSKQNICLQPGYGIPKGNKVKTPNEPVNGWLSIEMGRFSTTTRSENGKLFISLTEGRRMDSSTRTGGVIPKKKGLIIGGVIVEPMLMDHAKRFMCLVFSLALMSFKTALHKPFSSSN